MTPTDIENGFRELDRNKRMKLLGELWDDVSTEPALFGRSEDARTELKRPATPSDVTIWSRRLIGASAAVKWFIP